MKLNDGSIMSALIPCNIPELIRVYRETDVSNDILLGINHDITQ